MCYKVCPICGARLDCGERCDCQDEDSNSEPQKQKDEKEKVKDDRKT